MGEILLTTLKGSLQVCNEHTVEVNVTLSSLSIWWLTACGTEDQKELAKGKSR